MKIPLILAQENIPAAIPAGSAETAMAPYAAMAHAGQTISHVAETIAHTQRMMYNQGVKIEAATLQSQMELGAETALQTRKVTETDPEAYRTGAAQDIHAAYQEAIGQAKYPETRQLLQQHLQHVLAMKGIEVMKHSNALDINRKQGLLETHLDTLMSLGAGAPDQPAVTAFNEPGLYSTVKGRTDYFKEGQRAILNATAINGEKATADKLIAWRKDYGDAMARADLRSDPNKDMSQYAPVVGPEKYDRLLAHQETLIRTANVVWDKWLARVERDTEDERVAQLVTLDQKARDKTLTAQDVTNATTMRVIKTPAELDHVYAMMAATDRPSDPDVLRRLSTNAHSERPTVTDTQIRQSMDDWAAGKPGLNVKDGTALQDRLRTQDAFLTTKADTVEARAQAMKDRRYNRAKEEGYKHLGLTTMLDQLDPISKKLVADFDSDLNARSDALNVTGEDSFAVMREILPRYLSAQRQEARLGYSAQLKTIDTSVQAGPAPDAMDATWQAWYLATSRRVEEIKISNPALYAVQTRQLLNLLNAHGKMIDNAIRSQNVPAALGRSATTPTVPRPTH